MAQKTSKRAVMGRYQTRGEDFLHLVDNNGSDIGGIDPTGTGWGALGSSGFIPPPTKTLFVDGNRTDTYSADGSLLKPFKTIMGAVNQIITNNDNLQISYLVQVSPCVYDETVDLSDPSLRNLTFVGFGAQIGVQTHPATTLVRAVNNDNLLNCLFFGFTFLSGSGAPHAFEFSSTTDGTNFASGHIAISFYDCDMLSNSDFYINNCGGVSWDRCYITMNVNVTNCILALMKGTSFNQGPSFNVVTNNSAPKPSGFVASQIQCQNSTCLATVTIDSGSSFIAAMGSRIRNTVTVNGTFTSRMTHTSGSIIVNSGGVYKEDGGAGHTGSLTLNGTGSYQQTGTFGAGVLKVGGIQISAGSGAPNGVVSGSPGDIYVNVAGGALTTLWIKETGVLTNVGWVGK